MKLIKIPKDLTSQEIKEKIKSFENQLRRYIRILGLIVMVVLLEVVLILFSFINIDYLPIIFGLFSVFVFWKTWKKIDEITMGLVIYKMLDDLNEK